MIKDYLEEAATAQEFNRGKSSKRFREVYKTKRPLRVIKNSRDYMVVIDYYEYNKLLKKLKQYENMEAKNDIK